MSDKPYDGGSKWLLEHQGRAIALLGGLTDVIRAKSLQSETVQPRQLPDGLLEVHQKGQKEPDLLLVEFCTYPESRTPKQLADDIALVSQTRDVLPEVLALVFRPKGKMEVPITTRSAAKRAGRWRRLRGK